MSEAKHDGVTFYIDRKDFCSSRKKAFRKRVRAYDLLYQEGTTENKSILLREIKSL